MSPDVARLVQRARWIEYRAISWPELSTDGPERIAMFMRIASLLSAHAVLAHLGHDSAPPEIDDFDPRMEMRRLAQEGWLTLDGEIQGQLFELISAAELVEAIYNPTLNAPPQPGATQPARQIFVTTLETMRVRVGSPPRPDYVPV